MQAMKIMSARIRLDEISLMGIVELANFGGPLLVLVEYRERGHGDYAVFTRKLTPNGGKYPGSSPWMDYSTYGEGAPSPIPEVEAEVKALMDDAPVLGDDFLKVH
jgi:hypothetical protein